MKQNNTIRITAAIIVSFVLFSFLFAAPFINFWYQMPLTVVILCTIAYSCDKQDFRNMLAVDLRKSAFKTLAWGLASAILLYFVFYAGNIAAAWIRGGSERIADVYTLKNDNPIWLMGLVIGFIVGPGEELFWRGFVQRNISGGNSLKGVAITSILYCLVHLASGNFMLLAAALICGIFWGLIYWKFKNIYINIISHVVWDLLVFIFFPFN